MSDTWQGKELTGSPILGFLNVHYRIHDVDTGELLGFGTSGGDGGALMSVVQHYSEVQEKNQGRRIVIRAYEEPAYYTEQ